MDDLLEWGAMPSEPWAGSDDATAVRAEWRAEETEWSHAALEQWEHNRTLADVARDAMHRGDRVSFAFPSLTWTGTLVAVGDDLARVDTGDGLVDVRLGADAPFVVRTAPPSSDTGHRGDGTVTTFLARLRELDGTAVRIGSGTDDLQGEMRVGRDQLRVVDRDGGCAYVPIDSSWWVRAVEAD